MISEPTPHRRSSSRGVWLAGGLIVGLLAACERGDGSTEVQKREPQPVAAGPAPAAIAGFVGRWAATPDMCRRQAWVFTEERLNTPAGTYCGWSPGEVEATIEGWTIPAVCEAEGESSVRPLVLARGADASTITVSGGPFGGAVTLGVCDEGGLTPTAADSRAPREEAEVLEARFRREGVRSYEFKHALVFNDAWRIGDDLLKTRERNAEGGESERIYYFRAGDDEPFLVIDPRAAYAFADGAMTWWYDESGAPVSDASPQDRTDRAQAVLARGRTLYRAANG